MLDLQTHSLVESNFKVKQRFEYYRFIMQDDINMYVCYYIILHLSNSDHFCYIHLVSFTNPEDLYLESRYLVP